LNKARLDGLARCCVTASRLRICYQERRSKNLPGSY